MYYFLLRPDLTELNFVETLTSEPKSHFSKLHVSPTIKSSLETCIKVFASIRKLRNGKKYDTASNTIKSENSNSEGNPAMNSRGTNKNEDPEVHAITQEEVDEQIKNFIATLTRKLWDLTRLVQGMTTASHANYDPRAGTIASCSAPGYQPDKWFKQIDWNCMEDTVYLHFITYGFWRKLEEHPEINIFLEKQTVTLLRFFYFQYT